MEIQGKTAVITGAARGIGLALAERFGRDGAAVALFDVNEEALQAAHSSLQKQGVTVRTYRVDVADETSVGVGMDAVVRDFGRLDVLVNNAGIIRDALLVKARDGEIAGRMTLTQWREVIDVNLTGVFLCGREAAERMIRLRSGGVIINISSVSRHGNAGQSNYSAAKAGVVALAAVWSKELARHGIRAAAIAPGGVRTDILQAMRPDMLAKLIAPVPLQRLAEPREIADAAAFIVGNDFFTGRCIDLDGGPRD